MKKTVVVTRAFILITILFALNACRNKTSSHLLRLNLEKGRTYEYEIVQEQQQEMMGQESETNIKASYLMEVVDVKDGIQSVKVTYKRFRMYMKIMDFVLDIDTDKPAPPLTSEEIQANPLGKMGNIFAGIKDKTFNLQLDNEGKVLAATGFDKIVGEMIQPLAVDENTMLQIRASLQDQFNEESIKDQFTPFFNIFPNKEVKQGENWQKTWKTGGRMPSSLVTTYTVKDIDGDQVNLQTETMIHSNKKEMDIKGVQKGPLLLDSKSGLVINGKFEQHTEAVYQNMKIDVKSNSEIKGKRL